MNFRMATSLPLSLRKNGAAIIGRVQDRDQDQPREGYAGGTSLVSTDGEHFRIALPHPEAPVMTAPVARPRRVWLLVLSHFVVVVLVIVATRWVVGGRGALTLPNQVPWTSIIWAQMGLLSLYLGLGQQRFALRLVGFLTGMSVTIGCTLFAWHLLTGPPPKLFKWLATWFVQDATLVIPEGLCVAALIMAARPVFGAISSEHEDLRGSGQFSLRDLVGFMTLAAAVVGLLRWTFALDFADFTDYFKYFPLIVGGRAVGLVGCAILVLAPSRRWIGLPLLALAIAGDFFVWPPHETLDWLSMAYRWGVVLVSLAVVCAAGYRLQGGRWLP
jgi:hypothetical protein